MSIMLSPWLERDTPQTLAYLFLFLSFTSAMVSHSHTITLLDAQHQISTPTLLGTKTVPPLLLTSNFCFGWESLADLHMLSQTSPLILNNLRNERISRDQDITCTIDIVQFGLKASCESHSTQLRSRVVCKQMFLFCCCIDRPRLDKVSSFSAVLPDVSHTDELSGSFSGLDSLGTSLHIRWLALAVHWASQSSVWAPQIFSSNSFMEARK